MIAESIFLYRTHVSLRLERSPVCLAKHTGDFYINIVVLLEPWIYFTTFSAAS